MSGISNNVLIITVLLVGLTAKKELRSQTKDDYVKILNKFQQWKSSQYKTGRFATERNCIPDTVTKENYKGPEMGIPKDIDIFFTDLNKDNKIDALITFHPDQCDGGNALMNAQIQIIILSKGLTYAVDDTYISKIEQQLKKGWLRIDKALYGEITGTYFEYSKNDGRCCPGICRLFSINYLTKKLIFNDSR